MGPVGFESLVGRRVFDERCADPLVGWIFLFLGFDSRHGLDRLCRYGFPLVGSYFWGLIVRSSFLFSFTDTISF